MAWSQTKDDLLRRCLMLGEDVDANEDRLICFEKLVGECCLGVSKAVVTTALPSSLETNTPDPDHQTTESAASNPIWHDRVKSQVSRGVKPPSNQTPPRPGRRKGRRPSDQGRASHLGGKLK